MVWNDNNIEIGGRPDTNGGANLYKGLLDELAVYDRALTAAEVGNSHERQRHPDR